MMNMKQLTKTEYLCKRYRLYEFLTSEGFTCKQILTDATNKNYVNWLYDITPEFKESIEWYFEKVEAKDYEAIQERMIKR